MSDPVFALAAAAAVRTREYGQRRQTEWDQAAASGAALNAVADALIPSSPAAATLAGALLAAVPHLNAAETPLCDTPDLPMPSRLMLSALRESANGHHAIAAHQLLTQPTYRDDVRNALRQFARDAEWEWWARLCVARQRDYPDLEPSPASTAPALPPIGTGRSEGETPPAGDPFADLRRLARDLSKQERAVMEALCNSGGELSLADVRTLCDWQDPIESAWNSLRMRLNKKLESHGWKVKTQGGAARLNKLDAK